LNREQKESYNEKRHVEYTYGADNTPGWFEKWVGNASHEAYDGEAFIDPEPGEYDPHEQHENEKADAVEDDQVRYIKHDPHS